MLLLYSRLRVISFQHLQYLVTEWLTANHNSPDMQFAEEKLKTTSVLTSHSIGQISCAESKQNECCSVI